MQWIKAQSAWVQSMVILLFHMAPLGKLNSLQNEDNNEITVFPSLNFN